MCYNCNMYSNNQELLNLIKKLEENTIKAAPKMAMQNDLRLQRLYRNPEYQFFSGNWRRSNPILINNQSLNSPVNNIAIEMVNIVNSPSDRIMLQKNIEQLEQQLSFRRNSFIYRQSSVEAGEFLRKRYPQYSPDTITQTISIIVNEAIKQLIAYFIKKQLNEEEQKDFELCLDIFEVFNSSYTILAQNKNKLKKGAAIIKLIHLTGKYLSWSG